MVEEHQKYIELALSKIQSDIDNVKNTLARVEEFSYHLSKRLNKAENTLSHIRGGFYVFISVCTIILALNTIFR